MKTWIASLIMLQATSGLCLAETKTISVDYESGTGTIDIVLGANRNPLRWLNSLGLVDMTDKLHDVGITTLRTHGIAEDHSHPTNLEGIFPDWQSDWWDGSNDPYLDPANYNFDNAQHTTPIPGTYTYVYEQSTDFKIADIIDNGFAPVFRIGYSTIDNKWDRFDHLGYTYMPNPIPDSDSAREKTAQVCEHIVKHYNEGWHNGYEHGIEFWEVWNEADMQGMWGADLNSTEYSTALANGTLSLQFKKMYAAIATQIRGTQSNPMRPEVKIGTCALAWTQYPTAYHLDKSRQFCEELLQYCRDHDVPLDFYSWHQYGGMVGANLSFGGNAYTYLGSAKRIRDALDANGFANSLSICDEWNSLIDQNNPYHDSFLAEAFTAEVLMYLDYANVYMANYWPMARGWGLFDEYANYTKEAYAYKASSILREDTPTRLAVTSGLVMNVDPASADNCAIMAGRSDDGMKVQVLLADEDQKWIKTPGQTYWLSSSGSDWLVNAIPDPSRPSYNAVSLTLENLPPNREFTVTYRTIDVNGVWVESAPESHVTGCDDRTIVLQRVWTPPAVCLVQISLVGPPPEPDVPGDFDCDRDVDQENFGRFQTCFSGPGIVQEAPPCLGARLDEDEDVDQDDFAIFQDCMSGANITADPDCAL